MRKLENTLSVWLKVNVPKTLRSHVDYLLYCILYHLYRNEANEPQLFLLFLRCAS